jgi:hypothetical protein
MESSLSHHGVLWQLQGCSVGLEGSFWPLAAQERLPMNLGSHETCRRFPLSPSEGERVGERGPPLPWGSGAQSASNCRGGSHPARHHCAAMLPFLSVLALRSPSSVFYPLWRPPGNALADVMHPGSACQKDLARTPTVTPTPRIQIPSGGHPPHPARRHGTAMLRSLSAPPRRRQAAKTGIRDAAAGGMHSESGGTERRSPTRLDPPSPTRRVGDRRSGLANPPRLPWLTGCSTPRA